VVSILAFNMELSLDSSVPMQIKGGGYVNILWVCSVKGSNFLFCLAL
jgi:hypothetical protein